MYRDSRDMQLTTKGALIQRFDILKNMFKPVSMCVDLVLRQCIKHEGVIRVWRMS
jgi:hypothetical protein